MSQDLVEVKSDIWVPKKNIAIRGNSKKKGPHVAACVICLRERKEVNTA